MAKAAHGEKGGVQIQVCVWSDSNLAKVSVHLPAMVSRTLASTF